MALRQSCFLSQRTGSASQLRQPLAEGEKGTNLPLRQFFSRPAQARMVPYRQQELSCWPPAHKSSLAANQPRAQTAGKDVVQQAREPAEDPGQQHIYNAGAAYI